jgi:hypothetical protein
VPVQTSRREGSEPEQGKALGQYKGRQWAITRVGSGQGYMKAMVLYKRRYWVSTREISWPIQIEGSGLIQAFTRKAVVQYKPVDGKAVVQGKAAGQYKGKAFG